MLNSTLPSGLFRSDSLPVSLGAAGAASGISRAIGLLRGIVLAWIVPQSEFGLFGVAQLVANVLLPICCIGLYEGAARYAPFFESGGTLRAFVRRVAILALGIAIPACCIMFVLAERLGGMFFSATRLTATSARKLDQEAELESLMRAVVVCVLALVVYQTALGFLRGLRMFRALGTAEVMSAVMFTVLAVAAAMLGHTTAKALMHVYAISCAVPLLFLGRGMLAQARASTPNPERVVRLPRLGILSYSAYVAATAIVWQALSYYPMWHLAKVSGNETVGVFHAIRIVTQLIHIAAAILTTVVAANVTSIWEHENRVAASARLITLTKAIILVLLALSVTLLLAKKIVMYLIPPAFAAGSVAYDPLVLFFLLVGVVGLTVVRLNLLEQPLRVFIAWLAGGVVNVVASFVMMGPVGSSTVSAAVALESAAWAGIAGVVTSLAVCILFLRGDVLRFDARTGLLILGCFSITLGWVAGILIVPAILLVSWATNLIFTSNDRAELRRCLADKHDR